MEGLAAQLFAEHGYDGCRDLREALRLVMAEHRATVAAERLAAGLARPRSQRKPTATERAARSMGPGFTSESTMRRMATVNRWAPELADSIAAGTITVWAAYQQAIRARDAAAVAALHDGRTAPTAATSQA